MKLPPEKVHVIADKGEHAFHASYLSVEAFHGSAPLSYIAALILLCIVAHALADYLAR
jgi:hypothetical protein